ncbi:hypothetical protein AOLI_G00016860 [Acnodon oligacanthus]
MLPQTFHQNKGHKARTLGLIHRSSIPHPVRKSHWLKADTRAHAVEVTVAYLASRHERLRFGQTDRADLWSIGNGLSQSHQGNVIDGVGVDEALMGDDGSDRNTCLGGPSRLALRLCFPKHICHTSGVKRLKKTERQGF